MYRCCVLICSFIFTTAVFGQQPKVNIDKKNITLGDFLTEIRKQTGFDFVSLTNKLDFSRRIDPKFTDGDLDMVLDKYFNAHTGVVYVYRNNSIILMDEQKAKLRKITGSVVHAETGKMMAGVTVSFPVK